jgi:hypothetical protein
MLPQLLELGPITVYSYGVLLASAYLLALYYSVRRARRFGLDGNRVLDLGIYIIISALIGAKLLLLIVDFDYFRRQPAELWTLVRSGGVFYGVLVLAFAVGFWYVSKHRLPVWPVADAIAPGIALGHVVRALRLPAGLAAAARGSRRCRGASRSRTRSPPAMSARRCTWRSTRRSCTMPGSSSSSCSSCSGPSGSGGGARGGRSGCTSCSTGSRAS